jgi:type VI secretion system secreted protein Hcp
MATFFLRIDGIEGQSTHKRHPQEIQVVSFSFGAAQAAAGYSSGAGAGAGRVSFQDFSVGARPSKASPLLLVACASGRHFRSAVFTIGDDDGDWLEFRFEDVIVSSYQMGGTGEDPVEQLSLSFAKIELRYTERTAAGKAAGQAAGGWDLAANKPA